MADTVKVGTWNVNRMGFGAMRITGDGVWGEPDDHDNAVAVLRKAVELGINFIDTADAYGPEVSENLINEALHPYDGVLIATKGGLTRSGPGQWHADCSPEHLREAIEGSLSRLDVEKIELYQLHTVDSSVPFEDSLNALIELQNQGKIVNIGLSNVSTEHLQYALSATQIASVQNSYNVTSRGHEDVLRMCEENDIAFIPYFPVGGNSGGFSDSVMHAIADVHDATVHQIALAWLLQHSPVMLPIPGTKSLDHLVENVAATDIELTAEEISQLDALAG